MAVAVRIVVAATQSCRNNNDLIKSQITHSIGDDVAMCECVTVCVCEHVFLSVTLILGERERARAHAECFNLLLHDDNRIFFSCGI